MRDLHMTARLAARKLFPQRNWFPIEAWFDIRYDKAFQQMRASAAEIEAQRIVARDADGPAFSIVVPLFKTPIEYLHDMVRSVLGQTYPNFELILVNASPEIAELQAEVNRYIAEDARVKTVTLDRNLGITENTNRGIEVATGDFVCFMDHDDWIEPDTLFEYAAALHEHDDIDLLYCDEDLVEKEGGTWRHRHPLFKPDFSPELLLCKNFVVHLLTVRRSLIDSLPTPGSEFDGAQDYNMTFMASERARRIHHVPRVLYHWRMSETSTAANSAAKPYGKRAYRLSAQRHLERSGVKGSIVGSGIVNIHTIWFQPDGRCKVSIVVASSSPVDPQAMQAFLDAFDRVNTYENVEVICVCSESDNALFPCKNERVSVQILKVPEHANLLERFNEGAKEATGDLLMFADYGCHFATPEPLEQIVGLHERAGVGIAAPKTMFIDYTVKSYGIGVSGNGIAPLYRGYSFDYPSDQCNMRAFQNPSAVSYQGLAITRSLFQAIGGFDISFSGEVGSVDLCCRVREQGERIALNCNVMMLSGEYSPNQPFTAHEIFSDFPPDEIDRFYRKWPGAHDWTDRSRNPHLDLRCGYPVIRYDKLTRAQG